MLFYFKHVRWNNFISHTFQSWKLKVNVLNKENYEKCSNWSTCRKRATKIKDQLCGKNSPSLFTYHTHDDLDTADPSSV